MSVVDQLGSDGTPIPPPFVVNVIDGEPYQVAGLTQDVESVQTTVQWTEDMRVTMSSAKNGVLAVYVNGERVWGSKDDPA